MADVSFTIEAIDKASAALTGIRGAMFSLNQTMQAAQQVYNQVSRVVDQTIGAYVRYADEMDKIHRLTGIQLEDASRLVQAADDVFVSQESLISGMQFAIRQGYQPSVEWLKKTADTLMEMEDPTDRARKAIEIFGRQAGPELLKFLELGSSGIDEYMASVNEGLVLTEDSRQATLEYKKALDDLNDAWTGFKMGIVGKLIQPLTAYLQLIAAGPSMIEHFARATAYAIGGSFDSFDEELRLMGEHGSAFATTVMDMAYGTNEFKEKVEETIPPLDDAGDSLGNLEMRSAYVQLALGKLTQSEYDNIVALHNFDAAIAAWGDKPITKKIIIDMWFSAYGDIAVQQGMEDRGAYLQAQAERMGAGAGSTGNPMWIPDPANSGHYMLNPAHKAAGGYVSGRYAITGDSISGQRTGYEELVDFQQKRVYSAPETQAMGAVPRYAMGSGEISLSYQTIQDLANAVAQKMSGYV